MYVEVPWLGRVDVFNVNLDGDTVEGLKQRIEERFDLSLAPSDGIYITHEEHNNALWGSGPPDGWTLAEKGVGDRHTLILHRLAPTPSPTHTIIYVIAPDGREANFTASFLFGLNAIS